MGKRKPLPRLIHLWPSESGNQTVSAPFPERTITAEHSTYMTQMAPEDLSNENFRLMVKICEDLERKRNSMFEQVDRMLESFRLGIK